MSPGRPWRPATTTVAVLGALLVAALGVVPGPRLSRPAAAAPRAPTAAGPTKPVSPRGSSTGPPTGASHPSRDAAAAVPASWVVVENARRGTTGWRIAAGQEAGQQELTGWADRASVTPGQSFGLHVSSTLGAFTVTAYRLGWYAGTGARAVWTSRPVHGVPQGPPVLDALRTVTTTWPVSVEVSTTGWPEGVYLLRLAARRKAHYVPVTVRSAATTGRVVVLDAVATEQAYNAWGGYSLYHGADGSFGTRSRAVSFDRPYDGNGAERLLSYEQPAIAFAEQRGLDLAYETSWDLDHVPGLLAGARGVLSLGHDEYWSVGMRAAVEHARDLGTNVAFLGANALYWRVRFARHGRTIVGYKSAMLDPVQGRSDTTAMWRQAPDPDPENGLTGQLYECFPARGALVVQTPGLFLFRGTNVRRGSSFPGLVGTEVDRAYPVTGTPATLQVAAHSPASCGSGGLRTWSDLTYYAAPSGAGVVDVGTMLWVRALAGPDGRYGITAAGTAFARVVTANLLAAMAVGPMGSAHPPQPNLASLHASPRTDTGSGGEYQLP